MNVLPWPRAVRHDVAPVQFDQAARQRQPDAQPALRGLGRAAGLHEHVEHGVQHFGRDADAIVLHADDGLAVHRLRSQRDVPAGGRVLGGVVEQVGEHLREPHAVAFQRQRAVGQMQHELVLRGIEQWAAQLQRVVQHLAQVDGAHVRLDLAARDARDLHEVVDQPHHVVDLAPHHVVVAHRLVGSRPLALEQRQRGLQRRQRIAQLVRQRGQKFGLALVGQPQALQRGAQVVLPVARPQGRPHRTHERRHPHRPLDHGDVGHAVHGLGHDARIGALARQHQHRQVGPGRLSLQGLGQPRGGRIGEGLFGQHQGTGAACQLVRQCGQRGAVQHRYAGALEHRPCHQRVPGCCGTHQDPAFERFGGFAHGGLLAGVSTGMGTPVRMPRKLRRGSPMWMPVSVSEKSRMVRSCWPPRFLTTEIAWRTSPASSK